MTAPAVTTTTPTWTTLTTPDGPFTLIRDLDGAVLASGWTDVVEELRALIHPSLRPATVTASSDAGPAGAAVSRYYAGQLDAIDEIPVRQHSGEFLLHAWKVLRTVAPGDPVSYQEFADRAGRPPAVRAAASACARNATALFVPCHRVLRTDGSLGGFRYGTDIKSSLLAREAHPARDRDTATVS
ncbi:methylated-DNA--[protein]-cysteine S-methyltransferase [Williamsia sterculiae]|uniref:Methylated-DNA-[protein]-cysteine S-methyltransferase n=1 Tax=Williamsia sterculiae TaxID=1344003 RepID=A0A1N7FU40_9NOCA|nr:methylated-DNA--[protein]-cysteine S-methyltransferase [Williamsia sterculiae]SIS03859.1 methylated-DNA-[protein]-cysteine S-methyltransferase [Williamsia sterculiae]